jgi:hypothetical protein
MVLASDIAARIENDFPLSDVPRVKDLLLELQRQDPSTFVDRTLRCLVYVANGKFHTLTDAVTLARTDVRDLIVAAEYDLGWKRVRDFNKSFELAV